MLRKSHIPIYNSEIDPLPPRMGFKWVILGIVGLIILILILCQGCAYSYTVDNIANAIYKTENSVKHPYGILKHYKRTTPRQACINTIKHRLKQWNGKGDFIVFLGLRYSPPYINPNWVRLVHYFLIKGE